MSFKARQEKGAPLCVRFCVLRRTPHFVILCTSFSEIALCWELITEIGSQRNYNLKVSYIKFFNIFVINFFNLNRIYVKCFFLYFLHND